MYVGTQYKDRDPAITDVAAIGTEWVNTNNGARWICIESTRRLNGGQTVNWKRHGFDHAYMMQNAGGDDAEIKESIAAIEKDLDSVTSSNQTTAKNLSDHLENHPTEVTVGTVDLEEGVSELEDGKLYVYIESEE